MERYTIESYEGTKPYIFISYAHRDSDRVLPVLQQLAARGYRIWYDDGIAPGSEWPENIARHLNDCGLVMAFISPNSVESSNCRREINFALAQHKPFLAVLLEQTELPLGMQLQLNDLQFIKRYQFQEEMAFLDKLCDCPEVEDCREAAPQALVASEPETIAMPEPRPETKSKVKARPQREKKSPKPRKKARKILLLGAALALTAVLALVLALGDVTVLPGVKVKRTAASVTLREQQITAQAVRKLNSLKKLNYLYIYDCVLEPGVLDELKLPELRSIEMKNTYPDSFQFLENRPKLQTLTLENCGVENDSLPLASLQSLQKLDLAGNVGVSQLPEVSFETLRYLDISGTGIRDISRVAEGKKLIEFRCANTQVSSIDVLAPLENLILLDCRGCPISHVSVPFMSLRMRNLYLGDTDLASAEGFESFTVLVRVDISGTKLTSADWIAKSAATLEELDVSGSALDAQALDILRNAVKLTKLNVSGIALGDCLKLAHLTQLTHLYATGCGLTDISQLSKLQSLKQLYLDHNCLTGLAGLPDLSGNSGVVLNLAYNQITDISALKGGFYAVALQGNPVDWSAQSPEQWTYSALFLDYNQSVDTAEFATTGRLYLLNCPADRRLDMQACMNRVYFIAAEEELQEKLSTWKLVYSKPLS